MTVRRCRRCGQSAVISVRDWGTTALFGLVDLDRVSRQDFRCQHCGAAFTLRPAPVVRAIVGPMVFVPFIGFGTIIALGGLSALFDRTVFATALFLGGSLLAGLSSLGTWHFVQPWLNDRRNPVVADAPIPDLRFDRAEPLRRCRCGAPAPATKVVANSTNKVPTGTDTTHTCPSCRREFTVSDVWGIVFNALAASFVTPLWVLFIVYPPGGNEVFDTENLVMIGILGLLTLFGWGMFVSAIVARLRHPVASSPADAAAQSRS